jgi:hypothetical protein
MEWRKPAAVVLVAAGSVSIPALAQAPSNDKRAEARVVTVPETVQGTTRDATTDPNEPGSSCAGADSTVWYSLEPKETQRVAIELEARGDLDAVVEVYRRERSQLQSVECDPTNRRGVASVVFTATKDERYLIRVGRRFGSEHGDFTMELFAPEAEATPPGTRLPRSGGRATVDRARDLSDAWSRFLVAGTPYVFTLASRSEGCPRVEIHEPGIGSFDERPPLKVRRCNRHGLFTPDRNGRHSFLVRPGRGEEGPQAYLLKVRRARLDDTAPGNVIENYERVRGHVGPKRADVVDLHRFYVRHRSDATLRFSTDGEVQLELRRVRGGLVSTSAGEDLRTVLRRGRYYATVRSTGASGAKYTLRPAIRKVTRTHIRINRKREAVIRPGQPANVNVRVVPPSVGRVTIVVERLDPLEGWQFHRRFVVRMSGRRVFASFVPQRPGRFRARAVFSGSRLAAPSETGYAYVSAREPF